jgi:hypothetical protein
MLRRGWNRLKAALQPVFKGIKAVLRILEGFLFILTPLIIILIVILIIMLLDSYGTYWRELQQMEREGEVVWGKMIDSYNPDEEETYLGVMYPTYYNPEEIGLVRIGYYSREQLLALPEGAPVQIRHLPNELETTVMLEQYFDPLRNLWQLNQTSVIILAVCWLIIAWHPEMLYLGYQDQEKYDPFARFIQGSK